MRYYKRFSRVLGLALNEISDEQASKKTTFKKTYVN